jgi:uncharacterized RDD family membrane protein YckC
MAYQVPQTALLRLAAFLVDTLSISLLLILPSSIISYIVAWLGGTTGAINIVWFVTLGILLIGILIRDGVRGGRSPGKMLLGLTLATRSGRPCGIVTSMVRNLPLVTPGWNIIELLLVLAGRRRTGDRLAGTTVSEE